MVPWLYKVRLFTNRIKLTLPSSTLKYYMKRQYYFETGKKTEEIALMAAKDLQAIVVIAFMCPPLKKKNTYKLGVY